MPLPPPSSDTKPGPQLSNANGSGAKSAGKFITHNPGDFVKRLKEIDNDHEVLIVLKTSSAPRISKATLTELPAGGSIALPKTEGNVTQRNSPGFAPVNNQSRQAIRGILTSKNLEKFRAPDFGNLITVTLPETKAKGVITALLNNPNVDYIEANQSFPIKFASNSNTYFDATSLSRASSGFMFADPQGTNPADEKHTFHNVLDAWDYTRGTGARVGILDTGFSFDQNTDTPHPDGQLLTSTKGIKKLGFVDDYDSFGNCNGGSGQPYGNCLEWDDDGEDEGHGTRMAGLVGANDNDQGYVGVMPDGLTVSMKIGQNCTVTQVCNDNSFIFEVESDDFNWAVSWARNNDIDVLSMSFELPHRGDFFPWTTLYNNLYDAYHTDDILLLSSTGNNSSDPSYPQLLAFVMGVGGLDSNGISFGVEQFEEVSALSGGGTLDVDCIPYTFCQPQSGGTFLNAPLGGTSSSTAITAGIAGLVRAYNPSLSAPQVRQRLINTSVGGNNEVDALRAITNDIPLSVTIDGPYIINSSGNYDWEAMPEDGDAGYSYQWEYKQNGSPSWQTVATTKIYTRYVDTSDQNFYLRVTVTSGSEQDFDQRFINVTSEDCPPEEICPEG